MLHDNIFSCELLPSKDGYTFTIVSQLGPMLHEAERSFGQVKTIQYLVSN